MLHKRRHVQDRQLLDGSIEDRRTHVPRESRLKQKSVCFRHSCVGRRRESTSGRMVGVVCNRRRSGDANRTVPPEIYQRQGLGRADRHDQPVIDIGARELAALATCEPITRESLPEHAMDGFGHIEDRVTACRIAEPTGNGNGSQRVATEPIVDQPVHSVKADRAKPSANAVRIVRRAHAKSPCRSPFAAAVARSVSPWRNRASGFAPLSDGRGVVNQTHAA